MERKCTRCKQRLTEEDYLCPRCGAILGQPDAEGGVSAVSAGKKEVFAWRRLLSVLLALVFILAVGAAGWFLRDWVAEGPTASTPTTVPSWDYTASVITSCGVGLSGSVAHVYLDGQEVLSSPLSFDGKVSFLLPKQEGYSIRLSGLPVQYQYHYGESEYLFSPGQMHMEIPLQEKPVPFTVKVVDTLGQPVADVGICFRSHGEPGQQLVTDAQGRCTFDSMFSAEDHSADLRFVPNGYFPWNGSVSFAPDSLECQLTLQTWQEAGVDPQTLHTIRVLDEYGQPASHISLHLRAVYEDPFVLTGGEAITTNITNMEGCVTFAWREPVDRYSVQVTGRTDSEELYFQIQQTQRQLLIQLPSEPRTYTIRFVDQDGQPVPGVQISVPLQGVSAKPYTSDSKGVISFSSRDVKGWESQFYVISVPKGFDVGPERQFLFPDGETEVTVTIENTGRIDYHILVVDENGRPVPGATVLMKGASGSSAETTGVQGTAVIWLPPADDYEVVIVHLPAAYAHLEFPTLTNMGSEFNIKLEPLTMTETE